jgi:hypothetical protein
VRWGLSPTCDVTVLITRPLRLEICNLKGQSKRFRLADPMRLVVCHHQADWVLYGQASRAISTR